ncbi:Crp/Fnr family transcriptional regulator [Pedobacter sp. AW1-32]|uniref:Crp/Fnr family transcriptional regulator n=1 Tax=Pedobacter sp. AW1-32 TaxID=3383026 RepID=UPI003FF138D4
MQNTLHTIRSTAALSLSAITALTSELERSELKKGAILIRENKYEDHFYFLESGIARASILIKYKPVAIWLGFSGDVCLSFNSYVYQKAGYERIDILQDAVVYGIKASRLQELYQIYPDLANWGRKMAEHELIKTEERFISKQFKTASERYEALTLQYPEALKNIPLGIIASYLGVTQVTLSRIRAAMK